MSDIGTAALGAGAVVVGAILALLGGLTSETLRQRAEQRRWQHDIRLDCYSSLLDISRLLHNSCYRAIRLANSTDESAVREHEKALRDAADQRRIFAEAIARAELVASSATILRIRTVSELTHDDYYAAQPRHARVHDPHVQLRAGDRNELTPIEVWHAAREDMKNAFRRDLGMNTVDISVWLREVNADGISQHELEGGLVIG